MAIWEKLRGELIDVIEWTDDTRDTLVYRFERHNNEIKHGARLTVREGQAAVFVNEGEIADIFAPGMHTLETANVPILSTLQGWKHGFESPFKAEVYFVSTRRFSDLKWGTKNPVVMRDAEFGPIRVRAFGTYETRVTNPAALIREVVGTDGRFTIDEVINQLRNIVVSRFADILAEHKIPILDLAANYDELGKLLAVKIGPEFEGYGLGLLTMLVENISLPEEVEKALDKRSSMGIVGDLNAYTRFQAANALEQAAGQGGEGGGLASGALGAGIGLAMGQQMAGQLQQGAGASPAAPPPLPTAALYHAAINGAQAGPFSIPELRLRVSSGEVTPETLVWTNGMAGWVKASEVPDLAVLFAPPAGGPPPLPTDA
jgi:membrane protease subunit (stomatin/prohibitin family)